MKTKISKILMISFIFTCVLLIGLSQLALPVSADENDLGIKAGDTFSWTITDVDDEYIETVKKGDTKIVRIEGIAYFEDNEMWCLYLNMLNFDEESGEDKFDDYYRFIMENGTLAGYPGDFIPNEDIEEYLEDIASTDPEFSADDNEFKDEDIGTTNFTTTIEYNDLGVLAKYTWEVNDTTAWEYELVAGAIPFGIEFLFFIPIGIIGCIYIVKKRMERGNNEV